MMQLFPPYTGYLSSMPACVVREQICESEPIHKVTILKFNMPEGSNPDIYQSQQLWQWRNSDVGKWVIEKSVELPQWHRRDDVMNFDIEYAITAKLTERDYFIWILKFA